MRHAIKCSAALVVCIADVRLHKAPRGFRYSLDPVHNHRNTALATSALFMMPGVSWLKHNCDIIEMSMASQIIYL